MALPHRPRFLTGIAAPALLLACIILMQMAAPAMAARHHRHAAPATARRAVVRMPVSPTDPDKDAALVVDGATGRVLYARNETAERHPASLTKMMTLYLLFDALKAGKVTMQTQLPVSYHASIQKPTKLGLRPGQTISVDLAIRSLVIRSANDAAVVIAEALGGTESHFGEMMTARARQLGMRSTNYHNASGLPDPLQISTASDLAILGRHLAYDYPQYFPYFGLAGFNYKGAWIPTHDNLIGRYDGADGIKTGYTGASGFNLVSSVTRGTTHLIAVVMGGRTAVRRDLEMVRLLDQTFAQINANPTLVARATVPWQQAAQGTPAPAIAGFTLPQVAAPSSQFAALSPVPSTVQSDDEDAAESVRAPDENLALIHAEGSRPAAPVNAPAPAPAAPPPAPQTNVPVAQAAPQPAVPSMAKAPAAASRSDGKLAASQAELVRTAVNAPRPQMRPALRDDAAQADPEAVTLTPGRNWTIQIGAYADKALAMAQLKNYAGKAQDILAKYSQIIAPLQSNNGHVIYRARFGPFAEQEAREVCNRLTQRGQVCFAAVQTR